ncbi:glycerophosphodiester phosphodiesterase [Acidovorax sp. HDW3]|uniref:glycerophosphodiester phosphodiesterase n=1 Tax=Acidovorax sp. HDW3 TaxID=2714923 RepID=UPI00140D47B7|nr:glycerophosphodiester phosphodiesterase [Acidovorax sp. HDW3]QIL44692.1 glycerophosphodiester phosphodiesterase [Acidovorax sp. HDW3]
MIRTAAFAKLVLAMGAISSLAACGGGDDAPTWPPERAVIAHRGASALRPEHTLAAYQKAIDDGADIIEPDLVITKDGVLVSRHENAIAILNTDGTVREATTNVAERPDFAGRKTTKTIDGSIITGWFIEDFTLAEIKTLRARERIPTIRPANTKYNDQFEIATLQEIIDLAKSQSAVKGRTIGIEPETKHPTYFQSIGLPLEKPLLVTLEKNGWNNKNAPVIVQSFEVTNLKELSKLSTVRLAQLVSNNGRPYDFVAQGVSNTRTYADMITPAGLKEIATYAHTVAPYKELIIPVVRDASGAATGLGQPTDLIKNAKAAGLKVHTWTFRPENNFLPASLKGAPVGDANARGNSVAEIQAYLKAGLDALFTDDSAVGRQAVDTFKP